MTTQQPPTRPTRIGQSDIPGDSNGNHTPRATALSNESHGQKPDWLETVVGHIRHAATTNGPDMDRHAKTGDAMPTQTPAHRPSSITVVSDPNDCLDRLLPSDALAIHPTWFAVDRPTAGLPESILAHLPSQIRDQVALLSGSSDRSEGSLSPVQAAEAAKALWSKLEGMDVTTASDLTARLVALDPDWLEHLIEVLGMELCGVILSAVPQRVAAAFCANLPNAQARIVWAHRQHPPYRPSRSLLKMLAPRTDPGQARQTVQAIGLTVLAAALGKDTRGFNMVLQRLARAPSIAITKPGPELSHEAARARLVAQLDVLQPNQGAQKGRAMNQTDHDQQAPDSKPHSESEPSSQTGSDEYDPEGQSGR
ncbi:MAG: hypothetical protein J7M25_05100 [Deltaproteobacteria bacterium]|nr:hypothetical protein [Deltaproteobacteria bacterium]